MEAQISPLLPLYRRERAADRSFVLAVVVATRGSTYRKPGALMAIAADGSYAGLLSGGCLESDRREHARAVIESGRTREVSYDTGGSDDLIWGLGVGCEGAMQILLLPVGPANAWQPLAHLESALARHTPTAFAVALGDGARGGAGTIFVPEGDEAPVLAAAAHAAQAQALELGGQRVLAVPLALPPRLLLLGGGPDALPLVELARSLNWRVTVYDHRPASARAEQFPPGTQVVLGRPEALHEHLDAGAYEAAVVMSHHLPSDLAYLQVLAQASTAYVGLLGPPLRRERLMSELGHDAAALAPRLHAPVGLDLGGRAPESIALAIIAEIHAWLHGRAGGPMQASVASTRGE